MRKLLALVVLAATVLLMLVQFGPPAVFRLRTGRFNHVRWGPA